MSEYRIFRVIRTEGQHYFDIEYVRDLVRCEECKWADNCSQNVAIRESYQMYEKLNFCSYGERKENE